MNTAAASDETNSPEGGRDTGPRSLAKRVDGARGAVQDIGGGIHFGGGGGGGGKAYLLYEFTRAVPGIEVVGLDISTYGLAHAKEEVRPFLREGHARELPFDDDSFDLVLSLATLHNLGIADLFAAVREIQRVGRAANYIMVESYRDEREKANLLYWQLTCESFFRPEGWHWIYDQCGYDGDSEFIYFE